MKKMDNKVTSALSLDKSDIILLQGIEPIINDVKKNFMFRDITKENLNYLVREITERVNQYLRGHLFFNHLDNNFYSFAYVRLSIHNDSGSIEYTPMFRREYKIC